MAKKSRTIPFKADLDPRALEDFVSAPESRSTTRASEPPIPTRSREANAEIRPAGPPTDGATDRPSGNPRPAARSGEGKASRPKKKAVGTSSGRKTERRSAVEDLDPEELARLIDPEAARVQFGFKMPEPLKERLLDYRAATGREMQELVILGTAIALLRVEERFGTIPARKEVKVSRTLRAEDLL